MSSTAIETNWGRGYETARFLDDSTDTEFAGHAADLEWQLWRRRAALRRY